MYEHLTELQAPNNARLYLWFEPWAEGLGFPPGCLVELRGVSQIEGELEFDVTEERTAVYGWAGSTVDVIVDGKVVHSFNQPVPDAPTTLSTRELVTMLFGPAPLRLHRQFSLEGPRILQHGAGRKNISIRLGGAAVVMTAGHVDVLVTDHLEKSFATRRQNGLQGMARNLIH